MNRSSRLFAGITLTITALLTGACSSQEPTPLSACATDNDCKGTRVCEKGACVEPGGAGGKASTTTSSAATTGSGGSGGSAAVTSSSSSASATTGTGMTQDGGPTFLSFGTNVTTVHEGDTVVFTAILTDPQGVDDVIGGSLKAANGSAYGAFATSGQEGAYQMSLTWQQIQQVAAFTFPYGGSESRTFTATFFDQGGHMATATVTLKFTCSNGGERCGAVCYDTQTDPNHCGTCDPTSCGGGCMNGGCLSACQIAGTGASCDLYCANINKTCTTKCGAGAYVTKLNNTCSGALTPLTCDSTFFNSTQSVKCCCE